MKLTIKCHKSRKTTKEQKKATNLRESKFFYKNKATDYEKRRKKPQTRQQKMRLKEGSPKEKKKHYKKVTKVHKNRE